MKVKIIQIPSRSFIIKRKFLFWWVDDGASVYENFKKVYKACGIIYPCATIVGCEFLKDDKE